MNIEKNSINNRIIKKGVLLINVILIMMWGWNRYYISNSMTGQMHFIPEAAITLDEPTEGINIKYDGNALYYIISDRQASKIPFFLHIYLWDNSYMTVQQKEVGFINLDFNLQDIYSELVNSEYTVKIILPYAFEQISYIETGQYMHDGQRVWEKNYFLGDLVE